MAGYPSNLAKKFYPTEQFPQHILPLLPLYNSQWWGYESLTAICFGLICLQFIDESRTAFAIQWMFNFKILTFQFQSFESNRRPSCKWKLIVCNV